jgi:hypothetical protein
MPVSCFDFLREANSLPTAQFFFDFVALTVFLILVSPPGNILPFAAASEAHRTRVRRQP